MNKEFLYKLLQTPSPSGFELNIQKLIQKEMANDVDKFITHHSFNLISVINPHEDFKVLLCGHIDEVGLMVSYINDNGLINVDTVGNSIAKVYLGQHIQILNSKKIIHGVVATTNYHKEKYDIGDILIDIGTYSKEETEKLVNVGDYIVHSSNYQELAGNKLAARALDNKLGAFIILEAIKKARQAQVGLYAATTVGEETTGRGAHFATNIVKPNMAIIVDVTYATEHDKKNNTKSLIALGDGAAITIGSIINPKLVALVEESAKRLNLKLQYEVASERTYTDSDHVHFKENGVPLILISIPLHYMHSAVEVCDLDDVKNIIDLIADLLIHLDPKINFDPFG